ncbi:MAG: YkvA family protein [Dehalococcoidia bacterium]
MIDVPTWSVWVIAGVVIAVLLTFAGLSYGIARLLQDREPYATVLKLRSREKLRFFRRAVTNKNVPMRVKFIPVLLALYLANPIDLIPDFIPVLGYVDDVAVIVIALALMIRFTPNDVVLELVSQSRNEASQ